MRDTKSLQVLLNSNYMNQSHTKTTLQNMTVPKNADLAILVFSLAFFSSLLPLSMFSAVARESKIKLSMCTFWVAKFVAN